MTAIKTGRSCKRSLATVKEPSPTGPDPTRAAQFLPAAISRSVGLLTMIQDVSPRENSRHVLSRRHQPRACQLRMLMKSLLGVSIAGTSAKKKEHLSTYAGMLLIAFERLLLSYLSSDSI